MTKILKLFLFVFLVLAIPAKAQQLLSSSGTTFSGASGQITFSIGEPIIDTYTDTNKILTQGFHQTKLSGVSIEEKPNSGFFMTVFPNPTSEKLYLMIDTGEFSSLRFELFDLNGKQILNSKIVSEKSEIDFSQLAAATYILKVYQNNESIKTFKILKQF